MLHKRPESKYTTYQAALELVAALKNIDNPEKLLKESYALSAREEEALLKARSEIADHKATLTEINRAQELLDQTQSDIQTKEESLNRLSVQLNDKKSKLDEKEEELKATGISQNIQLTSIKTRETQVGIRESKASQKEEALTTREKEISVSEERIKAKAARIKAEAETV